MRESLGSQFKKLAQFWPSFASERSGWALVSFEVRVVLIVSVFEDLERCRRALRPALIGFESIPCWTVCSDG